MRRIATLIALALLTVMTPTSSVSATPVTATPVTAAPVTASPVPEAGKRPAKPRAVKAVAGDRSVTVRWKKPKTAGAKPILGYRVDMKDGSSWRQVTTVASSIRRLVVPGFTNGATASVRVAAVSAAGRGKFVTASTTLPAALGVSTDGGTANDDGNHSCAITPARTVVCWGDHIRGALGTGFPTPTRVPYPVAVTGLTNVAEVKVGGESACARTLSGEVWCWGSDEYDQNPGFSDTSTPTKIEGVTGARSLEVGVIHACALIDDATLRCWGHNQQGQVGSGNTAPIGVAVTPALTDVAQVSIGVFHTCAVKTDKTLWCWGQSSARHAFGLPSTGNYLTPTQVEDVSNVAQVAAGGSFTCIRLTNGNGMCAGRNDNGQLGNATTTASDTFTTMVDVGTMTSIRAGQWSVCATYSDFVLRCWGDNFGAGLGINEPLTDYKAAPTPVVGLGIVRSFDIGSNNICALIATNHVRCVGRNGSGQLGIGTETGAEVAWVQPIGL